LRKTNAYAPYQRKWAHTDFTAWVRDVDYATIREVPAKPMIEDLSFVANPRYWGHGVSP
jgi:hypothetical protein